VGDTVLVAAGTYSESTACLTDEAVVCILNKEITILGGYSTGDWSTADPGANETIIDGQGIRRGVMVQRTGPSEPFTSLHMEGFTIQNGRDQGASGGGNGQTFAFGGGMIADASLVVLKQMVFRDNVAVGGDTSAGYGGAAGGGGLALRAAPSGTTLEDIVFDSNEARGGRGPSRGGYAIGGGLYTYQTVVTGAHLTFTNNVAIGGSSPGSGELDRQRADGQGAAFGIQVGSNASFEHVAAVDNTTVGGAASTYGGGAYGGAGFAELATLTLRDAELRGNVAVGGAAGTGGIGGGGALASSNAELEVDRVWVVDNRATGGDGTTKRGAAGGGGGYLTRNGADVGLRIRNSVIADNLAETGGGAGQVAGGGGGGLWLQGVEAEVVHTTFAGNRLGSAPMEGLGLVVVNYGCATPSTIEVVYGIIANHTSHGGTEALWVGEGNSTTLERTLWAGNGRDTNAGDSGAGTVVDRDPVRALCPGFVSAGAPSYDYHLSSASPAIDRVEGSVEGVDIDGEARPSNGWSDLGADEYMQPSLWLHPPRGASETLGLEWQANTSLMAEVDHYSLYVSCEAGARPPDQGPCESPFDVGQQWSYTLTGLTNGGVYTVTVEAWDAWGGLLATSNMVTGIPRDFDHKVFVPFVLSCR
jgi:hypothetical protein